MHISLIENSTAITFPSRMAPGTSQNNFACKLRYPNQISEKATVSLRAGFPNASGGVTYFGDKIDVVIGPSNASDQSSTVNDNTSQHSNPKDFEQLPTKT